MDVKDSRDPFIFDVEVEQECATSEEVYLHPYHYGGFGFRGSASWNAEDEQQFDGAMKILTSDGITDIEESNHTRPRWVAVYGPIEGSEAGVVIMNHPDNPIRNAIIDIRHVIPVMIMPGTTATDTVAGIGNYAFTGQFM